MTDAIISHWYYTTEGQLDMVSYGTTDFESVKAKFDRDLEPGQERTPWKDKVEVRGYLGENCELIYAEINVVERILERDIGDTYMNPDEMLNKHRISSEEFMVALKEQGAIDATVEDTKNFYGVEGAKNVPEKESPCEASDTVYSSNRVLINTFPGNKT